jgi:hypothetical protein
MADTIPQELDLTEDEEAGLRRITAMLQDMGYRAKIDPATKLVITSTGGLVSTIFSFPTRNIQLRCMIGGAGADLPLPAVNLFNQQRRFVKLYVDDEQDMLMEADFIFNETRDHAKTDFEIIITLWESSVSDLKELLKTAATSTGHLPD